MQFKHIAGQAAVKQRLINTVNENRVSHAQLFLGPEGSGSLALAIACRKLVRDKKLDAPPMQKLVAAVSAGILDGQAIVDLNYEEDKLVTVDFNLVATEDGEFVEVQSSGEEATFTGSQLDEMLSLGRNGISALIGAQRAVLARIMVTPPES